MNQLPPIGKWKRFPTDDKPRHLNGAVKWMGDYGIVQNHATMQGVSVWSDDNATEGEKRDYAGLAREAARIERIERERAVTKANWILSQCKIENHPYLERKGFPKAKMPVWKKDGRLILAIPLGVGRQITSLQLISESGEKHFLSGGRTSMAHYIIGTGQPIFVEGFATGLSAYESVNGENRAVVVSFSASNMQALAKIGPPTSLVLADNDKSGAGMRAAEESGRPYIMSPIVGEDYNDWWQRDRLDAERALRDAIAAQSVRVASK